MTVQGSRRLGSVVRAVAAVLAAVTAASPGATSAGEPHFSPPGDVFVATKGSLPGFNDRDLPAYLVATMNAVAPTGWHFVSAGAGAKAPPERIEISFGSNPYAAGSVRTYGFSRATMDRLLNVHHSITMEARLFLGGQYQTLFFAPVTVSGGPQDSEFKEAVAKLTRALTAYPTLPGVS